MRFKNYRNPYTNDNRIYSFTDIYNMALGEVLKRKQELLSQYRVLGVPKEKELQGSDNVVHVEAYTRDDGTEVKAHWRSKPDGVASNNFSHGNPTGGAIEVNENEKEQTDDSADIKEENTEEEIKERQVDNVIAQDEISKENKIQELEQDNKQEEIDKKMYPDEIAGVKRGKPKTFEQMMQQGVNPKYMSDEDEYGEYSKNCQSCTVAAELVIRGYDVEAGPYSTPEAKELGNNGETAYIDSKTGEKCVRDIIFTNEVDCNDYLEQNVKQGERYELIYNTPTESGDKIFDLKNENRGHSVLITRGENGKLLYYDPQEYKTLEGNDAKKYISTWFQYEKTIVSPPRILRIDDKALNLKYVNKVVKKRNKS